VLESREIKKGAISARLGVISAAPRGESPEWQAQYFAIWCLRQARRSQGETIDVSTTAG
jgi:hypothetical protein